MNACAALKSRDGQKNTVTKEHSELVMLSFLHYYVGSCEGILCSTLFAMLVCTVDENAVLTEKKTALLSGDFHFHGIRLEIQANSILYSSKDNKIYL